MASVPILLLISSFGGYWISRKALTPVDKITATARSIGIRNLSERLPVTSTGDELQRLAETCNEMLDRLESAVMRLKQFTADASHELRGPLSVIRTVAEVSVRDPQVKGYSREAFQEIASETSKAAELLEQMLMLARTDTDSVGITMEPVDLSAIVKEMCARAEKIAEDRRQSICLICPDTSARFVLGDSASLRRLIWILLDNALKYTGPHGKIDVVLIYEATHSYVRVRDSGVGISQAESPVYF